MPSGGKHTATEAASQLQCCGTLSQSEGSRGGLQEGIGGRLEPADLDAKRRRPERLRDPWIKWRFGRDLVRSEDAWILQLALFPARRLMTPADDGLMIFAGLWIEVTFSSGGFMDRARGRFRPSIRATAWSDANEIGTRIARAAGFSKALGASTASPAGPSRSPGMPNNTTPEAT